MPVELLKRQMRRSKSRASKTLFNPEYLHWQTSTAVELFTTQHDEVLVDGPVNCSKTAWILFFLMSMHDQYPGFRSLVVRPEKSSVFSSIVHNCLMSFCCLIPKAITIRSMSAVGFIHRLRLSGSTAARWCSVAWTSRASSAGRTTSDRNPGY